MAESPERARPAEPTYAFEIAGMDCADCALTLERGVGRLPGVDEVVVDFTAGRMRVQADPARVPARLIIAEVRKLGYDVAEPRAALTEANERRGLRALVDFFSRDRRARLALSAGLLWVAAMLVALGPAPALALPLYALGILAGLFYPLRNGLAALRAGRRLDMNVLMTIGTLGAVALGEWSEGLAVIALFALGETLEAFTMERARAGIRALMTLAPEEAALVEGDGGYARRVPAAAVQPGQIIRVAPGERVALDGEIVAGRSSLNQAPITGESTPVTRGPGDSVFAGTINLDGSLDVRVSRPAGDTTLARIVALVEQAQALRAPAQRFVDRFAQVYTPAVVAGAALVALVPPLAAAAAGQPAAAPFSAWFYRALVLLVIACPCALVISTPVSIVSALANAARRGILIKGGAHLENAGRVRAVAFDKTGTLTLGQPQVRRVQALDGRDAAEVLTLAAAVERHSQHPVARALVREARHRGTPLPEVRDFAMLPGRGARARVGDDLVTVGRPDLFSHVPEPVRAALAALEAEGQTALLVGRAAADGNGRRGDAPEELLGLVAVADTVRRESAAAVAALHAAGIEHTIMLTGDNPAVAAAIAREAGLREFRAELLPADKVAAIEALAQRYGAVAMVGDGVNDAPALARAPVGIVMGVAGTDVALETADIALMQDDLRQVPFTIALSRATRRTVQANIAFALGLKAIFIVLALAGEATLWMAVFADMGASLLVTLNGMRLLRFRPKEPAE
jgi:Cd2+/Zn2+-exporting ATPase